MPHLFRNPLFFFAALSLTLLPAARADWILNAGPSEAELQTDGRANAALAARLAAKPSNFALDLTVKRPFADFEPVKYVLFSATDQFESPQIKKVVLQNLPAGVTAVIVARHGEEASVFSKYKAAIDPSRLKVISTSDSPSQMFWARDGLPLPVIMTDKLSGVESLGVVDAQYYFSFGADAEIASHFGAPVIKHGYRFEGGNLKADSKGNCFISHNSSHDSIPDSLFASDYGCLTLTRMPRVEGIGHIDEHVNFVSDTLVLTDNAEYRALLAAKGYETRMLPTAKKTYETYANALIVNGTAFVPTYGESGDETALAVYRDAGLTPIGIRSNKLSTVVKGSIHCITMAYPDAPFTP